MFVSFSPRWIEFKQSIYAFVVSEAPVFFGGGYVSLKDWYRLVA